MKKNQSGVSLIALVITIIVVIILAAVAFSASTSTIEQATFSDYSNEVSGVQSAFDRVAVTLKGTQGKDGVLREDEQVYNYVAKGATVLDATSGEAWLQRAIARDLACTEIVSGDLYEQVFDVERKSIKVNTDRSDSVEISYFVTNTGKVFTWPPYTLTNDQGIEEYYVNGETKVKSVSGDIQGIISGDDSKVMFEDGFTFEVDGVDIVVSASETPTPIAAEETNTASVPTIYYVDKSAPKSPMGRETAQLYKKADAPAASN